MTPTDRLFVDPTTRVLEKALLPVTCFVLSRPTGVKDAARGISCLLSDNGPRGIGLFFTTRHSLTPADRNTKTRIPSCDWFRKLDDEQKPRIRARPPLQYAYRYMLNPTFGHSWIRHDPKTCIHSSSVNAD